MDETRMLTPCEERIARAVHEARNTPFVHEFIVRWDMVSADEQRQCLAIGHAAIEAAFDEDEVAFIINASGEANFHDLSAETQGWLRDKARRIKQALVGTATWTRDGDVFVTAVHDDRITLEVRYVNDAGAERIETRTVTVDLPSKIEG